MLVRPGVLSPFRYIPQWLTDTNRSRQENYHFSFSHQKSLSLHCNLGKMSYVFCKSVMVKILVRCFITFKWKNTGRQEHTSICFRCSRFWVWLVAEWRMHLELLMEVQNERQSEIPDSQTHSFLPYPSWTTFVCELLTGSWKHQLTEWDDQWRYYSTIFEVCLWHFKFHHLTT
jgi:hypothetical protein